MSSRKPTISLNIDRAKTHLLGFLEMGLPKYKAEEDFVNRLIMVNSVLVWSTKACLDR